MNVDRKTLIDELEELARLSVKSVFYKWKNTHFKRFDPLVLSLSHLSICFKPNGQKAPSGRAQMQGVETTLNTLHQWLEAADLSLPPDNHDELILDWSMQLNDYLRTKPDQLRLGYRPGFWQDSVKDEWHIRLVKALLRVIFRNRVSDHKLRTVPLHNLVQYHIGIPVHRFIDDEREQYLKRVAWKIQNVRQQLERLKEFLLRHIEVRDQPPIASPGLTGMRRSRIPAGLDELRDSMNSWTEYEIQIDERFSRQWQSLRQFFMKVWDIAATFQHSSKRFRNSLIRKAAEEQNRARQKSQTEWGKFLAALKGSWIKDLEIMSLQLRITQQFHESAKELEERINLRIRPTLLDLKPVLRTNGDKLKRMKYDTAFPGNLLKIREHLIRDLRGQYLPQIVDAIIQSGLKTVLAEFREQAENAVLSLSKEVRVLRSSVRTDEPAHVRSEVIPLKDIIHTELFREFRNNHDRLCRQFGDALEQMLRSVSEVDLVLNLHFEEGIQKSAENGAMKEAKDLVTESLNWAVRLIDRLDREAVEFMTGTADNLRNVTAALVGELENVIREENLHDKKVRYYKHIRSTRRRELLRRISAGAGKLITVPKAGFRALSGRVTEIHTNLTTNVKRLEKRNSRFDRIAHFLRTLDTEKQVIPFVYKRLFTLDPLMEEKFFLNREEVLGHFETAWISGARRLILIGSPGCGKSTLVNVIEKRFLKDYKVIRIRTDRRITDAGEMDVLLEGINTSQDIPGKPRAVILEDVEYLFLRCYGGFEALHRLYTHMSGDKGIRWILTATEETWNYINRVSNASTIIDARIFLRPFDPGQIREIIRKRHHLSGYQLEFIPPSDFYAENGSPADQQDDVWDGELSRRFFDQMQKITLGNIRSALLYWLNAIDSVRDNRICLTLTPGPVLDYADLMSVEQLLILKMIRLHGVLTTREVASVFNWPHEYTQNRINQLYGDGFLRPKRGGYCVHPYLKYELLLQHREINV